MTAAGLPDPATEPATEPAADYRSRVEAELAPFDPTPDEVDAMVEFEGNIAASAAVMAAIAERLAGQFERQGANWH